MVWDEASYRREQRRTNKLKGLCIRCGKAPALFQRTQCQTCQMKSLIQEAFKYDRKRRSQGSTEHRGSCYVEFFSPAVRREWIAQIIGKWNGRCFYTNLPIEVGSTAGLDHKLPVSRAAVFGPSKVFHPDNLVWCHKSINVLKGERTAEEFYIWLRKDFREAVDSVPVGPGI